MTGYEIVRLSKIAHIRTIPALMLGPIKRRGGVRVRDKDLSPTDARRSSRPEWGFSVRQVEFSSAVKADFISAMLNGEHTAEMMMPAAKKELEKTQEEFHKSCARWRRSQLPLASNHSKSERTLARARAIAQSAAP